MVQNLGAGIWKNWLVQKALPLWSEAGYNYKNRFYYERLTYGAAPIMVPDQRLMVQARQIATFCRAHLDGVFQASENALLCLEEVQRRYWRCDGKLGWVFALAPDGTPSQTKRDLYAHAFIVFAYAWAYKLSGDKNLLRVVNETIFEIENIFSIDGGGFGDTIPPQDTLRRQNPHMHLLEAYLAMFEVTADTFYWERAQALIELACHKFICSQSEVVLEIFTENWQPCKDFGANTVEPGHQFEWSWLLSEAIRLNPRVTQNTTLLRFSEHLYLFARKYGVVQNSVCDGLNEHGQVTVDSTRIWPQTELARLLACRLKQNEFIDKYQEDKLLLENITENFFTIYAPDTLQGGWIDRLGKTGKPMVDHMPASSLYHIYGAAREFCIAPNV